jgi:CRISPR-associated protein Cas1
LEKKIFDKKDFIRTENYNIKLRPIGAKKLIKEVETQLNKTTNYLGRKYSWSYIIFLKARELAQYLFGKRSDVDFSIPSPNIERKDSYELREKILKLSYSKAKKLGIGKSELWYLKQKVISDGPFKIYKKVEEKLLRL